jgi:hypothetical protein
MDIFKLIYEHDLRLDNLRERHLDRDKQQTSGSIEEFMRPDPTYSKFYFTGTVLPDQIFGINRLECYPQFLEKFSKALSEYQTFSGDEKRELITAVEEAGIGEALVLTLRDRNQWDTDLLSIDSDSNVGHKKEALAGVLKSNDLVLYKEQAHNGFDLHLFSKRNIYPYFFKPFRQMVSDEFRFFSMNGKRITSERKFYFETWTLQRPPHGAEEVFRETVL